MLGMLARSTAPESQVRLVEASRYVLPPNNQISVGEGSKEARQQANTPQGIRALRAPVAQFLPGRSDAQVALQSRK